MVATRRREKLDEKGAVERAVDAVDHALIHRWPHIAGPLFLAGLVLGLATAVDAWGTTPVRWAATVLAGVVVFLAVESIGHLPGPRERGYAWCCWLGGGGWFVAACWLGPWQGDLFGWGLSPLFVVWAVLLLVGWPPWFKHRRVRRAVDVSKDLGAWDGDAVGLPGVDLVESGAGADDHSWWARIRPEVKGSYTLKDLRNRVPNIAARYNRRQSDVTIEPCTAEHEGEYLLRVQTSRREEAGAPYAVPKKRPTIREPFPIGHLGDRVSPLLCEVWRKGHGGVDGLTAGAKGGGKSNYFRRLAVQTIAAHDALLIVCDQKPGSPDYSDIGPHAYVYATTGEQIDLVMRVLRVLCEVRGWNKRPDRKVLTVLFDETSVYFTPTPVEGVPDEVTDPAERRKFMTAAKKTAEQVDDERQSNAQALIAVSRSFDISIQFATQRGEDKYLGGSAIRSNLLAGQVTGFYSAREADSSLVSSTADKDFNLTLLPRGRPGECLMMNGQHPQATRGTQHHVTDEAVAEVMRLFGGDQGDLHDDELEALGREFGLQWGALRAANRDARPAVVVPAAPSGPEGRMTAEESREHIWRTLAEFGRPAALSEIAAAAGKKETMTRARLGELEESGRVIRSGRNKGTRYDAVHVQPPRSGDS